MANKSKKPDRKMLELLVCPQTKGPLEYDAKKQQLISKSAKRIYHIQGRGSDYVNFGK